MANKTPTCPLCDNPAEVDRAGNRDAYVVECAVCGGFLITPETWHLVQQESNKPRRYLLSAATRNASESGKRLELLTYEAARLWEENRRPDSPFEVLDALLLHIHARTTSLTGEVALPLTDYPLFRLRGPEELREFGSRLTQLDLVESRYADDTYSYRLSLDGWRRVDELRKTGKMSDQAFVAMWFDRELDEAWQTGFAPALEATGWRPVRMDRLEHNDRIDDRIIAEIRRSGLMIADFTGNRAGVYFEAGLAYGLGIPVVWTVRNDHLPAVHFDTRQYNHIVWENARDLQEKLTLRLQATGLAKSQ